MRDNPLLNARRGAQAEVPVFGENPGASGHGCKGGEEVRTSPTRAQNHDPFANGKLKKWLDGLRAHNEGQGTIGAERWQGLAPNMKEVAYWVRWVHARCDWDRAIKAQPRADQDLWGKLVDLHWDSFEEDYQRLKRLGIEAACL